MNRVSPLYFLIIILLFSCNTNKKKPRIGITGLSIESSTFSPAITTDKEFDIRYSSEIFGRYPFFDQSYIDKADWFPTMTARALPGGVVSKESYEFMVLQILELTKQTLPLDGLFLDIHGAMNVEGMDDPEGDFIERLRAVIGNKTLIST